MGYSPPRNLSRGVKSVLFINDLVQFQDFLFGMNLTYFALIQSSITIFAAPVSASNLSFQTEKMRIVLHDMLLAEKGDFSFIKNTNIYCIHLS